MKHNSQWKNGRNKCENMLKQSPIILGVILMSLGVSVGGGVGIGLGLGGLGLNLYLGLCLGLRIGIGRRMML
jgi:hypothetical protein